MSTAASFAYERLKLHQASAAVQNARIWEAVDRAAALAAAEQEDPFANGADALVERRREQMVPVFCEIHFYLVAWTTCREMLIVLTGVPEFIEAKKVFDGYKGTFDHYVNGRNTFEHFRERLPEGKNADRVKEVQAPGAGPRRVMSGFKAPYYKHSDQEWDVSPESLVTLNSVVDEVIRLVLAETDALVKARFPAVQSNGPSPDR